MKIETKDISIIQELTEKARRTQKTILTGHFAYMVECIEQNITFSEEQCDSFVDEFDTFLEKYENIIRLQVKLNFPPLNSINSRSYE